MKPQTKKRLIIWSSVAVILGVGGYFAYKKIIKPKLDERKAKKAAEEAAKLAASTAASTPSGTTTPSSSSSPTGSPTNNAPLYPDDVKKFQDWLDKNRPNWVGATNFMLNNGKNLNRGAGYGNFGASTKKAYEYFGNKWKESIVYQQWQNSIAQPSATDVIGGWGFNPK
jgi:hypothetical protein